MLHIITRVTRHFVFWSFFTIACLLSAIRIALFCVDWYKIELETKLTELLDTPVKIGHLHAHLRRGLKPELILQDIKLPSSQAHTKSNIELQEIRLGIDLLKVLTQQQIMPATWVSLVGLKLSIIHKPDGSFSILGLQSGNEQPVWLLQGRQYELLQSEITWMDEKNHRRPRTFKQVDISIKNNDVTGRHQLNLLSQLPAAYGDTVRISTDFTGDFFTPNTLQAKLFITGKNLHFSKIITEELPLKISLKSGSSDFELWGTLENAQLTELSGQINNENLTVARSDQKKLLVSHLKSRFDWRNQANRWDLAVDDLSVTLAGKTYPSAQFYLGSPDKNGQQFSANIKSLDLDAIQTLSDFFGKDLPDFKNLIGLNVKGKLKNTEIFADLKQQHYAVNGQFQHLSLATPAPYPQLQNISGSIHGSQLQGVLTLNSQNSLFIAQPMFRTPLAITQLTGKLYWQQTAKNWQLSSTDLKLNTPYAQSTNTLQIKIPKQAKPTFMDLRSAFFNLNDVSNAKIYFPVTLMSPDLVKYLDAAFIKGQVKRGDLLFYGNVSDFPFKQHQGVFQVLFDAQDVTMKYAEGWPFFEHLNAGILFENDGLEVNIKQGKAELATINAAKISIPSFSDSDYVLVENGQYSADINDGLNFLRHTPLQLPLKSIAEQLKITGNTQGSLALKIPLSDKVPAKVTGDAQVANAKLNVLAIDLPIDNLTGTFRFTEQGFYSDTLSAFGLGYPMQAKVSLKPDSTLISVEAKTGIKDLEQHFKVSSSDLAQGASHYHLQIHLPFAEKSSPHLTVNSDLAQGASHYHLQIHLPFAEKSSPHLTVNSDLEGIKLNLPDSLAKTAQETKQFTLKFNLVDSPLLPVSLNYDQQLQANVLFNKNTKTLASGNLVFGKGEAQLPEPDKFSVSFNQAKFSAPIWLGVLDKMQVSGDKAQLLTQLEIHTPQLDWAGQSLGAFDLKLQRHADDWTGTLDCAAAQGQLLIPKNLEGNSKIKLEMEQIDLSSLMRLKLPKKTAEQSVSKLPLFEINSQKLLLRGINLGRLEIDSERMANGVKFKNFSVTSQEQTLSFTGDWQLQNNQQITRLEGKLKVQDFGQLLKKLNLNDDLEETNALINLDLHWQAAPYQFSLASLNGSMDIKLDEGRISSIEPGFGRLLGVLAVEQWLKRLQLNFGDIYKEGLSFNEISGHFVLSNGKATSTDLTVDAVPATITLTGEVNLLEQTMNQQISVIPKSSGAVPIAGTIVGGIATLVTQALTGEYEAGYYLRSKYQVKGKWNNLNITPLHAQDGLLQKTWRGLTDFSWITEPEQDKK